MKARMAFLLALLLSLPVRAADLTVPYRAAAADLRKLAADGAQTRNYRYLTDLAVPEAWRGNFQRLLNHHVNALSTAGPVPVAPETAGPSLYRVDISEYKWDAAVWERLAEVEPYFHVRVTAKFRNTRTGRVFEKTKNAHAPWLPLDDVAYLVEATGSEAPVVRADWFFHQTAIQADRVAGYYDWLGLKDRADYERLVGVDPKKAEERKRLFYSIVPKNKSGVAHQNRQILRLGAVDSSSWRTLDAKKSTGRSNARRNLGEDYKHDAEEHYGFLPNGLFAYFLCDQNGVRQDSAPDFIGYDKGSQSNDGRIHVMLACIRCHREGLRPIDDWARKFWSVPFGLGVTDPEDRAAREKTQQYLGDLAFHLKRDRELFDYALGQVSGWTPAQLADAYADWWRWYGEEDVGIERAADEWGTTPDLLRAAFTRSGLPAPAGSGRIDEVLGGYAKVPPIPASREEFEEVFQRGVVILQGGIDVPRKPED